MREWLALIFLAFCLQACAVELVGEKGDLAHLLYPAGMTLHPDGRYLYVVSSNFDLDYRATDGGVLSLVDLETGTLLADSSKQMGSFGTSVVLSADARRGYTVTRNDDCVVWFDISADGSEITCPLAKDSQSLLKCRYCIDDDPTDIEIVRSYREEELVLDDGSIAKKRVDFDLLMVAHLQGSKVTAITVQNDAQGLPVFSSAAASMVYGASDVLWHEGENFFVSGRSATNLTLLAPAINGNGEVLGLLAKQRIAVPLAYSSFSGRGMALSPNKRSLYLLNQLPNSLLSFDVSSLLSGAAENAEPRMVGMELMQRDPMKIAWVEQGGVSVLYMTSFKDDALVIVDPVSLNIVKQIELGDGPYEIIFDKTRNRVIIDHFRNAEIWIFNVVDPMNPELEKRLSLGKLVEGAV